jgi:hypothetical protein
METYGCKNTIPNRTERRGDEKLNDGMSEQRRIRKKTVIRGKKGRIIESGRKWKGDL